MSDGTVDDSQQTLDFKIDVVPPMQATPPSFYVRDSEVALRWRRLAELHLNAPTYLNISRDVKWSLSWSDRIFAESIVADLLIVDEGTALLRLASAGPKNAKILAGRQATIEVRVAGMKATQIRVYIGRSSFSHRMALPETLSGTANQNVQSASAFIIDCWPLRCNPFFHHLHSLSNDERSA